MLLIFNAIRTAVFARRREIEVMRLVGASNWFIRLPFIVEGLVHGLIGAFVASFLTWGFDALWKRNFINQTAFELLNQIRWDSGQLWLGDRDRLRDRRAHRRDRVGHRGQPLPQGLTARPIRSILDPVIWKVRVGQRTTWADPLSRRWRG